MKTLFSYKNQKLTKFPFALKFQKQITNLNLSDNSIHKFPRWIYKLENLKVLYLSNNKIEDLSPLQHLPNLTVLHLNDNQITEIPLEIIKLKKLKRLYLNNNLITEIPEFIDNFKDLEYLLLANNEIKNIHENIGRLHKLKNLILFNNRISILPDTIGNLNSLTYLQVSFNEIKILPNTLGNLSKMTDFECFSNKLKSLPKNFNEAKCLINLNIADNQFKTIDNIPLTIERLSIYNNPVQTIDQNIIDSIEKKSDDRYCYIFVDQSQLNLIPSAQLTIRKGLRLVDLDKKSMDWRNAKHIPSALQSKWNIKIERPSESRRPKDQKTEIKE